MIETSNINNTKILILAAMCMLLSGCNPITLGASALTKTGLVIAQERTPGEAVDDFTIWGQIKHHYLQKDVNELLAGVSVEVIEGKVHLTGTVTQPATRIHAVRLAWQPKGVKEVINEIQVGKPKKIKEYAKDKWIQTQIKSRLLLAEDIRSVNYTVEVVKGVVYLMGIAQDTKELNSVTNISSTTKYVNRVISHVRLKSDELSSI